MKSVFLCIVVAAATIASGQEAADDGPPKQRHDVHVKVVTKPMLLSPARQALKSARTYDLEVWNKKKGTDAELERKYREVISQFPKTLEAFAAYGGLLSAFTRNAYEAVHGPNTEAKWVAKKRRISEEALRACASLDESLSTRMPKLHGDISFPITYKGWEAQFISHYLNARKLEDETFETGLTYVRVYLSLNRDHVRDMLRLEAKLGWTRSPTDNADFENMVRRRFAKILSQGLLGAGGLCQSYLSIYGERHFLHYLRDLPEGTHQHIETRKCVLPLLELQDRIEVATHLRLKCLYLKTDNLAGRLYLLKSLYKRNTLWDFHLVLKGMASTSLIPEALDATEARLEQLGSPIPPMQLRELVGLLKDRKELTKNDRTLADRLDECLRMCRKHELLSSTEKAQPKTAN